MDAIGIMQPVVTTALPPVSLSGQDSAQAAPVVLPVAPSDPNIGNGVLPDQTPDFTAQAAEQKRAEAVQKAAQDIANVFVVSDKTFTIFKDATGQYITRFTSLRDGKVTYIPEPELFKLSGASAPVSDKPLLQIQA